MQITKEILDLAAEEAIDAVRNDLVYVIETSKDKHTRNYAVTSLRSLSTLEHQIKAKLSLRLLFE